MKALTPFLLLVPVALLAKGTLAATSQEPPAQSSERAAVTTADQHLWLQQFVGEWDGSCKMLNGDGVAIMSWKNTESISAIGDLWTVASGHTGYGNSAFSSRLTLGFDPDEAAFVGSYVDSIQTRMWTYRGTLDGERRALTLEAQGPSLDGKNPSANYRDVIEFVNKDHRRMVSKIENDEGEWVTYQTVDYRRRK